MYSLDALRFMPYFLINQILPKSHVKFTSSLVHVRIYYSVESYGELRIADYNFFGLGTTTQERKR